ncbi:SDR family NAD(P)-dependent oxidoreductase [Niabella ginsengisoli]|uniref:SDR family NAD(P)-dependent oxidoreductase n=1 Tax=Niabella ginsengisoli TaxID=522298 RepID=A0ABS9SJK1_9BACT|nr:SDR family NAD(P)-dependent oxidoreductase [Niabella ginsengisoli]MCH5598495.1 SDR family NAD(P)-dependent oxidoreductase [Niabella ginsengisoli]
MDKIVLITGATSGFGEACARKFAANNYDLIITGRRKDKLHQLSEDLRSKHEARVLALNFDVRNKNIVTTNINALPKEWQKIDILINNAGLALGRDNFEEASIDDWDAMIDTNVKGLAYVTKAVLPFMIDAGSGHIFNIGSISGKEVYAQGNMYCATKHAVGALSEAMRIDLLKYNIKVTAIHPGAANTEFSNVRFKGDADKAAKVYEGLKPLVAEDVADIIYYCAGLPAHVCINDLVVTSTQQANSFYSFKKI